MLQQINVGTADRHVMPVVYNFRNTFLRTDLADNAEAAADPSVTSLQLRTQLTTKREHFIYPHFSRSKYLVVPSLTDMVGVHRAHRIRRCYSPACTELVSENLGVLYHYRSWPDSKADDVVDDKTMWRFRERIINRTLLRHQRKRLL